MRSDLKKLDSFTLEMSKNHLICIFLRNGRLRVKMQNPDNVGVKKLLNPEPAMGVSNTVVQV